MKDLSGDFFEKLSKLYEEFNEKETKTKELLPQAGSDRRYVRFENEVGEKMLGAFNPDKAENNSFFYFTNLFRKFKLPVPEVFEVSQDKVFYLLEDLGEESLFDIILNEGHTERVKMLLKKSIDQLVRFQWEAGKAVDYSMCFSTSVFDREQILADLLYFKYYFVDLLKINYDKVALFSELEEWSRQLSEVRPQSFMFRDFQSRNIQVINDEVHFIDYQGGMLGFPQYDVASLLWQARANISEQWKRELLNYYFDALQNLPEIPRIDENQFKKDYVDFVLLRILQTLGAYGYRGLIEKKSHFLQSIVPALNQLSSFLGTYSNVPAYNELRQLLEKIVSPEIIARFEEKIFTQDQKDKLKIKIYSFSYKKGLPADETDHGGGFVFDCRGIYNPGRFEEYVTLTGKDKGVIKFLESKTEIGKFLDHIFQVVDITVNEYLNRGFDHLTISFGCTGGRHRSVYAAESMVKHLKEKFGLKAELLHMEQEVHQHNRR